MLEVGNSLACNGCHACYAICSVSAITMKSDSEGFLRPVIDYDLCTNCGMCELVCPVLHPIKVDNNPIAFACVNNNERVRSESSSGGVFTLFATEVLKKGGVVFGAKFDSEFNVVHDWTDTIDGLRDFRGSKYVQSNLGESFKQCKKFLVQGKAVLFSGTPCQIGGLKSFLKKNYENLITIDIICHGVPSPKAWNKYKELQMKNANSNIERIAFRSKNEGWKQFSVLFSFENKTEYCKNLHKDPFMQAFLTDTILRSSCHECIFKSIHRTSDITLADFWGIKHIAPLMDDDKGTSLLFINSENGKKLFENIDTEIEKLEVDINRAVTYNKAAIKSATPNKNRNKFFKELELFSFDKLVKNYCLPAICIRVVNKSKRIAVGVAKKLLGKKGIEIAKEVLGK